jgi:hypothetical protein
MEILYKGRTMKRIKKTTILKLLTLVTGLLLAVSSIGCDSVVADNRQEHLRLGEIARQNLQYGPSYMLTTQQNQTYHPAP